jgi:RimJ/RimL family protein N-acetyltransferase
VTLLRLLTLNDVDLLGGWHVDPDAGGEFQWFGYRPGNRLREMVANGTVIDPVSGGSLAVAADDGMLVGDISWFPRTYSPIAGTDAWMIGIIILTERRGEGHGSAAQRLIADYLFTNTPVHRVEASTDIDNVAEQRALEKAGFTREGVHRGAQFRGGEWRDMAMFSKLRGEP